MPETTTAIPTMEADAAVITMTREVREMLDFLVIKGLLVDTGLDARNELVREHFANDLSGYGIPVSEYIVGLSHERVNELIESTLALPEYND